MRTSVQGIELIQSFEGFRPRAARLPGGGWLIGYGHTATARAGLQITTRDAALILRHHDLPQIEQQIAEQVLTPLSQNEFDALVSFAFNIGPEAFAASDVVAALNAGDRALAANAMWAWRLANVSGELRVIDALARRRAAEIAHFLEHPAGRAAIPGALVRPLAQQGLDDEETGPGASSVTIGPRVTGETPAAAPENSTQAAARAVSERIARILGEAPPQPPSPPLPPVVQGEGPTPEEITDAVKALVGDEPVAAPLSPAAPPQRAKGPPEGIERRRMLRPATGSLADDTLAALPPAEGVVVDDLEIMQVDQRDLERAIQENGDLDTAAIHNLGAWAPYALLSGLGLVGLIAGVERFVSQAARPVLRTGDVYAGPVLALGGGFLFLIASYYLYRALTRQD
ncbi:MAG: lysozyme [Hyphomonas sp.]|uniref:lysozyme n=1 Tax=Hyphomonas sp. TaxID=87 RepID=UPI0034A05D7E